MPEPGTLVVIYGGPSAEHEISCISARRIAQTALDRAWPVRLVGLTHAKQWVDAQSELVDIDMGEALESPDELLAKHPDAELSDLATTCRPTPSSSPSCTGPSARTG